MMEWGTIIALGIAGLSFLWQVLRELSSDNTTLNERLVDLESLVDRHERDIERMEKQQTELKDSIKELQSGIHDLNIKMERVITILEEKKGH
jgi:chromosome segregation ATPase